MPIFKHAARTKCNPTNRICKHLYSTACYNVTLFVSFWTCTDLQSKFKKKRSERKYRPVFKWFYKAKNKPHEREKILNKKEECQQFALHFWPENVDRNIFVFLYRHIERRQCINIHRLKRDKNVIKYFWIVCFSSPALAASSFFSSSSLATHHFSDWKSRPPHEITYALETEASYFYWKQGFPFWCTSVNTCYVHCTNMSASQIFRNPIWSAK